MVMLILISQNDMIVDSRVSLFTVHYSLFTAFNYDSLIIYFLYPIMVLKGRQHIHGAFQTF